MPSDQTTRVPHVPVRTPMFDEEGRLTRTWIIFFERLGQLNGGGGSDTVTPRRYHRTLLLKDTTVGNDIADHVTVYRPGTGVRIAGVLRKAIASDLSVRVNKAGVALGTITIPAATLVDAVVELDITFAAPFLDEEVLTWDVTASDGSKDAAGVAAITVEWE